MKEQQKWTEDILGSLENVQKAVPDADFLSKMESLTTTFAKAPNVIPMSKVLFLAASLTALILINVLVVSRMVKSNINTGSYSQTEDSVVSDEYDLKPIQSFYYE